jgi:hypothetical protein
MKRLFQERKWKRYQRKRQHRQEAARRRSNKKRHARRRQEQGVSRLVRRERRERRSLQAVEAPPHFSIVDNPEESVAFVEQVGRVSRTHDQMFVDLQSVTMLTADAVAALVSRLTDRRRVARVRGSEPQQTSAQSLLAQSGFYDIVRSRRPILEQPTGLMRERTSVKVESETAAELIAFATQAVFGSARPEPASYRVLVETMSNTNNHAAGNSARHESWWATVYCDPTTQYVGFTFLDNGVGIFESAPIQTVRKMARMVGLTTNQQILREILKGGVGSRTRLHYRGKGIPAIYELQKSGRIRNLVIATNDVYANIEKDDFRYLEYPFRGTLLHWELPL